MATVLPVQKLQGTSAQNALVTLPSGVMVYLTDTKGLAVHDGVTAGGTIFSAGSTIFASDAEAIAGTETSKSVPPSALKAACGEANAPMVKAALNASGNAPIYACRAWVKFNGTGTVAINASGNVSSIGDNGTGLYTVNFTTAMPDSEYSVSGFATNNTDTNNESFVVSRDPAMTYTASACQITTTENTSSATARADSSSISVQFFR